MSSLYARYTPFDKEFDNVLPEDLYTLNEVHEGWYVEYKSDVPSNRALAKSLSAFANQYGGILFIGISTDRNANIPNGYPGILSTRVDDAYEQIRNSSKDLLNPPVFYTTRTFEGPIHSIRLPKGNSIIAVRVPQGPDTPYVHNDGRIYRRVADSSGPSPETDRTTLDLLHDRRRQVHSRLEDRILQTPIVSKGEKNQPYIHFNIFSDPYETMGHWYSGNMHEFIEIMQRGNIPFDNIYPSSEGFIARQTTKNNPYLRVFTWEFSRKCHSLVTFPINVIDRQNSHPAPLGHFLSRVDTSGLESARVLDLSMVMSGALNVMLRHRRLARQANVNGPFYVKIYIENVWRTIPFVDLERFSQNTADYGFPLVQDSDVVVPRAGGSLDTFIHLQERDITPEIGDNESLNGDNMSELWIDAGIIAAQIFMALGTSPDLIQDIIRSLILNANFTTPASD